MERSLTSILQKSKSKIKSTSDLSDYIIQSGPSESSITAPRSWIDPADWLLINEWLLVCICLFGYWQSVTSFRHYQDLIPNGQNVPHSCIENFLWHGIGHQSFKGGGPLNRFGVDFIKLKKVWKKLCPIDSDGDGMTNGQELGDPECKWTRNQIPERTVKITNPGICDPINTPACKGINYFLKCEEEYSQCNVLKEEGIKNFTVRMLKTTIPAQQTTYVHTFVELPSDGDYHMVAAKPFRDNVHVVHHIRLLGCDEYNGPINRPLNTPVFDNDFPYCSNIMTRWSVGHAGTCYEGDEAVRFGAKKGYRIAVLEIHWNNPEGYSNLTDSSGMTLFYTTKLRKHDIGTIIVGQMNINIPPRSDSVAISGTCSSECTRDKLTGPINIIFLDHHMHYLGIAAKIELFRNGTKIAVLSNEEHYIYGLQKLLYLKTPIQMLPGDEIKMSCLYMSKYKTTPTYYGQGVTSEMCYGFIYFYPIEHSPLSRCIDTGSFCFCTY